MSWVGWVVETGWSCEGVGLLGRGMGWLSVMDGSACRYHIVGVVVHIMAVS